MRTIPSGDMGWIEDARARQPWEVLAEAEREALDRRNRSGDRSEPRARVHLGFTPTWTRAVTGYDPGRGVARRRRAESLRAEARSADAAIALMREADATPEAIAGEVARLEDYRDSCLAEAGHLAGDAACPGCNDAELRDHEVCIVCHATASSPTQWPLQPRHEGAPLRARLRGDRASRARAG